MSVLWFLAGFYLGAGIFIYLTTWLLLTPSAKAALGVLLVTIMTISTVYLFTFSWESVLLKWLFAFGSSRNITGTFLLILTIASVVTVLVTVMKRVHVRYILRACVPLLGVLAYPLVRYLIADYQTLPVIRFIRDVLLMFGAAAALVTLLSELERRGVWLYQWFTGMSVAVVLAVVAMFYPLPQLEARFLSSPLQVDYDDVSLVGYRVSAQRLSDEPISGTLYWRLSQRPTSDFLVTLALVPLGQNETLTQLSSRVTPLGLPSVDAWFQGVVFKTPFVLPEITPADRPMSYAFTLSVRPDREDAVPLVVRSTDRQQVTPDNVILTTLPGEVTLVSPPDTLTGYTFANGIKLWGDVMTVHDGIVEIHFWWQTDRPIDQQYTQMLHFYQLETDTLYTQDGLPFGGRFAMPDWYIGMQVQDTVTVTLPADLPAGDYIIYTGLYDPVTVERINVQDVNGTPLPDARIDLGEITIR